MGLDTYAGRTPVDFFDPELDESTVDEHFGCTWLDRLALWRAQKRRERANDGYCLFQGNYFRGKLYVPLILYVTGVFLSQVWIPPETVKRMAEAFRKRSPEETIAAFEDSGESTRDYAATDVADLAEFFEVCARRGLGLLGSW